MAPPASEKKKGSAKAPAPAPAAAKKENKPAATAAKKAEPVKKVTEKKATEPKPSAATSKKTAEKKPSETKSVAAAPQTKKAKADAPAKAAAVKKPAPKKVSAAPKKTVLKGKTITVGGKKKKVATRFVIDCTLPAEDQLFNCADFEKFLRERIKVSGKTSNFGGNLNIERGERNKLAVNASIPFSKRYLKYLTKKYLKKNLLRDTLRVIATSKDGYELRYFQIGNEAEDDEEDAE